MSKKSTALGVGLLVVGGFTIAGSVTGTLPAMIAALFDPGILTSAPSSGSLNIIGAAGIAAGAAAAGAASGAAASGAEGAAAGAAAGEATAGGEAAASGGGSILEELLPAVFGASKVSGTPSGTVAT